MHAQNSAFRNVVLHRAYAECSEVIPEMGSTESRVTVQLNDFER